MMENKCSRCEYFDRFYTKETVGFEKTEFGWCCRQVRSVNVREGCDDYRHKKYQAKREILNSALKRRISDMLTEIAELRKVAEEEINERRADDEDQMQ